jgi:hypothetical protein
LIPSACSEHTTSAGRGPAAMYKIDRRTEAIRVYDRASHPSMSTDTIVSKPQSRYAIGFVHNCKKMRTQSPMISGLRPRAAWSYFVLANVSVDSRVDRNDDILVCTNTTSIIVPVIEQRVRWVTFLCLLPSPMHAPRLVRDRWATVVHV